MKLGGCDSLFPGDDTKKFPLAKQLGFDGIELFFSRDEIRDPGQARAKIAKEESARSGVAIPSIGLGHLNNGGWSSADPQVVNDATLDVRAAIPVAQMLGAKVILVPFFFAGHLHDDAGFERVVKHFRELCPIAEAHGVILAYEGQLPAERINELARRIDHPNFGCYFDLANVVWLGMDTADQIRKLGALIKHVHMKETKVGPGDVRPGQGRVNYAASKVALDEVGYKGWLVMETPSGPASQVAEDMAFTRKFFPA